MLLKLKSLLSLLQAFLMLISHFSVYDSAFKLKTDRAAMDLTALRDFTFAPVTAAALKVSAEEKQRCRDWFNAHVRTYNDPAYDFTVGGRSLRKNLADWDITVGPESAPGAVRRGGKTTYITLKHKKSGLTARVEATIYEEYAACEWTVHIKNTGDTNSPVISRFYGADCTLETGDAELYMSKGSDPAADDFELLQTTVSLTPMVFNANGGRSSSVLPYFNVCGKNLGAVLAVGWTGQWYTSLRQTLRGVKVQAKQEYFNAYLTPGESVRSPLVSLTFYTGGNALKGFETFRQMQLACVCPAQQRPMRGYVVANEFSTLTCDELIDLVRSIPAEVRDATDYYWMDAGWYEYTKDWYDGVGNWIPDKNRFPETLKPLSDVMKEQGKRFLLWYEPERVREGTALYNEATRHEGWIIKDGDNLMWNLADDGACAYLTDYISASLTENGVGIYRQDFNFTPLKYWQQADKALYGGRRGICENRYVTNLYRYLDALRERVDGLLIDNCASGGKRLDIEMMRRSVPLWRSDYNCGDADGTLKPDVLEATQSMTYGLSCWLPYSGTNQYFHSQYAVRSAMLTHASYGPADPAALAECERVRVYMTKNYFPLTYGGTDEKRVLAMQFGDEAAGTALLYRRAEAPGAYTLRLNGLEPERVYTLTDVDAPAFRVTLTGRELMETGTPLTLAAAPKAAVIFYTAG